MQGIYNAVFKSMVIVLIALAAYGLTSVNLMSSVPEDQIQIAKSQVTGPLLSQQ